MHDNINVAVGSPNVDYPRVYKTKFLKPGIPFVLQVTDPDTKYVIKHNFVLDGDVTIPANCLLEFDGGSLSNGIVNGDNTSIIAGRNCIFKTEGDDIDFSGTWNNVVSYPEWFDYTNILCSLQKCAKIAGKIDMKAGKTYICNDFNEAAVKSIKTTVAIVMDNKALVVEGNNSIIELSLTCNNNVNYSHHRIFELRNKSSLIIKNLTFEDYSDVHAYISDAGYGCNKTLVAAVGAPYNNDCKNDVSLINVNYHAHVNAGFDILFLTTGGKHIVKDCKFITDNNTEVDAETNVIWNSSVLWVMSYEQTLVDIDMQGCICVLEGKDDPFSFFSNTSSNITYDNNKSQEYHINISDCDITFNKGQIGQNFTFGESHSSQDYVIKYDIVVNNTKITKLNATKTDGNNPLFLKYTGKEHSYINVKFSSCNIYAYGTPYVNQTSGNIYGLMRGTSAHGNNKLDKVIFDSCIIDFGEYALWNTTNYSCGVDALFMNCQITADKLAAPISTWNDSLGTHKYKKCCIHSECNFYNIAEFEDCEFIHSTNAVNILYNTTPFIRTEVKGCKVNGLDIPRIGKGYTPILYSATYQGNVYKASPLRFGDTDRNLKVISLLLPNGASKIKVAGYASVAVDSFPASNIPTSGKYALGYKVLDASDNVLSKGVIYGMTIEDYNDNLALRTDISVINEDNAVQRIASSTIQNITRLMLIENTIYEIFGQLSLSTMGLTVPTGCVLKINDLGQFMSSYSCTLNLNNCKLIPDYDRLIDAGSVNKITVTNISIGTVKFDSVSGKPNWWNGTAWVDATGTPV